MEQVNSEGTVVEQGSREFGRVGIEHLLNPKDEDDAFENITDTESDPVNC